MKKILIIEDSEVIRETTAEYLEDEGYEVLRAENGVIGVAKAIKNLPDMILCDIIMPQLDGYGVYKELQANENTAKLPFMFLTGKSDKKEIEECLKLGVKDYLLKPFDYMDLLMKIEKKFKAVK